MNHPNKENKTLTLKNFRVFDNNGASVELSPITILTGCNGSGKSSIVKALLCLNASLSSVTAKDIFGLYPGQSPQIQIDFRHYPGSLLGGFKNTLNHNSKTTEITVEFNLYSHWLGENVTFSLVFKPDYQDSGRLYKYTVIGEDKTLIYSSINPGEKCIPNSSTWNEIALCDLTYLRNRFKVFLAKFMQDDDYYGQEDNDITALENILKEEKSKGHDDSVDDINWLDCNSSLFDTFYYEDHDIIELFNFIKTDIMTYYPILEKISSKDLSIIIGELNSHINKVETDLNDFVYADDEIWEVVLKDYIIVFKEQISELARISPKEFTSYYKKLEQNNLRFCNINIPINNDIISDLWNGTGTVKAKDLDSLTMNYYVVSDIRGLLKNEFFSCLKKLLFTLPYAKTKSKLNKILNERHNYKVVYSLFSKYVQNTIIDLFSIEIPSNIKYLASSNPSSQRGYSFNAHDSFSLILNKYFESRRSFDYAREREDAMKASAIKGSTKCKAEVSSAGKLELSPIDKKEDKNIKAPQKDTSNPFTKKENEFFGSWNVKPGSYINKWLKLFEIGDCIQIKRDNTLQLVSISIKKGNKLISIADEGFGVSQLLLTLFQIETIILEKISGDSYSPFQKTSTLAIEEPEVHLHPKFQSLLADLIIDAYKTYNIHFIVETHSEYLIRKLQVLVAQKKISSDAISIAYIDHSNKKKRNDNKQVKNITIKENGILSESFGEGFYDEATRLAFELF